MRGDEFFAQVARRPPFTKLHPQVAAFFKDYFAHEKAARFGEQVVVNTHFPAYPSPAFDRLADGFGRLGDAGTRQLYSVTLAVTNRCTFHCWHCYNAGRSQVDLPLATLSEVARQLQTRGAVMVTLTGGEPLLRTDLGEIAAAFDERSCVIVGTTGAGLTRHRARALRSAGVFAVGISLDSLHAAEHDRLRGRPGAFRMALAGLQAARAEGLYAYIVSVATREFLAPQHFLPFLRFAGEIGALEVHLLEPSATGRLSGRTDVLLRRAERELIFEYQRQVAGDDRLPILSAYAYLESPQAFGCGAGVTHLYVDGSGEVCPCQLVPLSFGNVMREPLAEILDRMGRYFRRPRAACIGRLLAPHLCADSLPMPADASCELCARCLPAKHPLPRFFQIHARARTSVGRAELRAAYDRVHGDYDQHWLSQAAQPIEALVRKLRWRGAERVFEAGCGTGYATVLLAERAGSVVAADLSRRMLARARQRLRGRGTGNVRLVAGDALELLGAGEPFDVVFSTWVLGYIPLKSFFAAAGRALAEGGRLAFVVHRENSPREPLEIFAELVARDPAVLRKRVAFDFPRDAEHVRGEIAAAGLEVTTLWEDAVVFRYDHPDAVLEHLLKSGAGTAFYDAIAPDRRAALTQAFLASLAGRRRSSADYEVRHDYIACIARKPRRSARTESHSRPRRRTNVVQRGRGGRTIG